jgi:hypothetical protein
MGRPFTVYQHRDGGLYLKLTEAKHSETGEALVIYICAASGDVWARPKAMFEEPGRFTEIPYITDRGARKALKLLP